jgi:hypothetical protein
MSARGGGPRSARAVDGRACLVSRHQPTVADHIGHQDCGEATVHPISSPLHGGSPSRSILYREAPARTTGERCLSIQLSRTPTGIADGRYGAILLKNSFLAMFDFWEACGRGIQKISWGTSQFVD